MPAQRDNVSMRPGAVQVDKVVLEYPLYRNLVFDRCRFLLGTVLSSKRPRGHRVLDQVSLAVEPGEVIGIVGLNGAGKTSLLKVISGLVSPSEGSVRVGGRVMALLSMGVGFHGAFTGRENLRYGGLLLGLEPREIEDLLPAIAEFSELGEALDQPYFTYSSGMCARLAFSLATSISADLVILDETLAAGDFRFVAKCYRRFKQLHASGKTILFVSHNLGEVARLASRVVVLQHGRKLFDGSVFEGLKVYEEALAQTATAVETVSPTLQDVAVSVVLLDESGHPLKVVELGQRVSIELTIVAQQDLGESFVFLKLMTMESNQLYAYLTMRRWETLREVLEQRDSLFIAAGETTVTWTLPHWICGEGTYYIDAYVGPACAPDAPDLSRGRFWRHAAHLRTIYSNAYLKGACGVAELPVESVAIKMPTAPLGRGGGDL